MKNKKVLIAGGLVAAAGVAYYLYKKNQPQSPTEAELEAARQEQIKKENVDHLLQVASETVKAAQTGGKAAMATPDFLKQSKASSLITFGTSTQPPAAVAGLGNAYALS